MECGSLKCSVRWYHPTCIGVHDVPDEWYCSQKCEENGYSFCVCREKRDEPQITCKAGDNCKRDRIYHMRCVGYVPELQIGGMFESSYNFTIVEYLLQRQFQLLGNI